MTRASMLALLRELEEASHQDSFDEKLARAEKLAAAISWLEDEKNITNGGCCNVDGWLLEDER